MILALAILALQTSQSKPGLPLVIGSRPEFQNTVHALEKALEDKDFTTASSLAAQLPRPQFTLGWDEKSIPEIMRPQLDEMRDLMLRVWKHIKNVDIQVASSGDINIRLAKMPPRQPGGLPAESQIELRPDGGENVTINLIRGNPPQSIIPADAYMEIGHAIGAYLGIADEVLPGSCMFRNDSPVQRAYGPSMKDFLIASHNLEVADRLRQLVKLQQSVPLEVPKLLLESGNGTIGTVRQGLKVPLDFKIKNEGAGLLRYNLVPDCGCFTKPPPGAIESGKEVTIRTVVNTAEYIGQVDKLLVLETNDPKDPMHQIPVSFKSTPAFRLYRPEGDTVILPVATKPVDVLLVLPDGSQLLPAQYRWTGGLDAKLTMEKWSGTAADPLLGEGPKTRHGYIFHLTPGADIPSGRSSGTIHIETGDEEFPNLEYTINFQKGIVALPGSLEFGLMDGVSRESFLVSRPGKGFKVLKVQSGTPCLKATINRLSSFEYRIDVIYDGTGPKGDFASTLRVLTDDPVQPELSVGLRGTVQ